MFEFDLKERSLIVEALERMLNEAERKIAWSNHQMLREVFSDPSGKSHASTIIEASRLRLDLVRLLEKLNA